MRRLHPPVAGLRMIRHDCLQDSSMLIYGLSRLFLALSADDDYFSSELHAPGSPSSPSSFQGSQQSPFDASQFDPMCGDMGDDDEMMFCNLSQSCPL